MTGVYADQIGCAPHGRRGRRFAPPWALMAPGGGPGFGPGHGPGFGPGHGPGFGPAGLFGGAGGPGFHGRRGRRARRGDVRAALLLLLAEEPRNGYQLMQEIEQRSGGVWRPSPGSVYPALAQLEDEGLVRTEEREGRRVYALTDDGRAHVEGQHDQPPPPWEELNDA